jgi:hypothetical protein
MRVKCMLFEGIGTIFPQAFPQYGGKPLAMEVSG